MFFPDLRSAATTVCVWPRCEVRTRALTPACQRTAWAKPSHRGPCKCTVRHGTHFSTIPSLKGPSTAAVTHSANGVVVQIREWIVDSFHLILLMNNEERKCHVWFPVRSCCKCLTKSVISLICLIHNPWFISIHIDEQVKRHCSGTTLDFNTEYCVNYLPRWTFLLWCITKHLPVASVWDLPSSYYQCPIC